MNAIHLKLDKVGVLFQLSSYIKKGQERIIFGCFFLKNLTFSLDFYPFQLFDEAFWRFVTAILYFVTTCLFLYLYCMLLKTRGIVLRAQKYSETSIIVDVFTEEKGLRSYIMSGVRTKRSKVSAGLLQVMALVDMVVYHREDKDLCRIKEIKAAHTYQSLPFNVMKGAVGLFMVEVAQKAIRIPEENKPLFDLLFDYFKYLDTSTLPISNIHLLFMLELTEFLGFMPDNNFDDTHRLFDLQEGFFIDYAPGHTNYLHEQLSAQLSQLLLLSKENCHELSLDRTDRKLILRAIIDYYRLHIDNLKPFNAHLILETVLG